MGDCSNKDAECPHFTDTDRDLCADKKLGKGQEADTTLPHNSPLAILLPQPGQTFIFSLLPHRHCF